MSAVRLGHRQLEALRDRLSDRDLAVARALRQHRFLTTAHLQRLFFAEHTTTGAGTRACVRVLHRLQSLRIVTRLERQIGGVRAGSAAFVWTLDTCGERLTRTSAQRGRFLEPSTTFLTHALGVAEVRVQLEEAARQGRFELLEVRIEQEGWRRHVGSGGEPIWIKPDLAALTASGDYEDHWLIEWDLGQESLRTLVRKCAAYDRYRRTGREQAEVGVFPLVLWLLPTARRVEALTAAIRAEPGLDPEPFIVVGAEHLIRVVEHGGLTKSDATIAGQANPTAATPALEGGRS